MYGDRQIKQILPPGEFYFDPLAKPQWTRVDKPAPDVNRTAKGEIRQPRRVRLEDVSWQHSDGLDWTLFLPTGADFISVPVEDADDASLRYYGCQLIGANDVIYLQHRSIIVNFCYQEEYLSSYVLGVRGGCSIEQHEFAHVDMPLDARSGHLVLGRIDPIDQSLELTAFSVKPLQRVYIPAKTIHTNDYLLGTWETLLSSDCEFPSAQIKQSTDAVSDRDQEQRLPPLVFCD